MLVTTLDALFMAKKRADMLDPRTEVSEYMDNWQENVHPKDIFISFDREMAKLRYKEMPNRIYCEMKPELIMEGSMDKGSFTVIRSRRPSRSMRRSNTRRFIRS